MERGFCFFFILFFFLEAVRCHTAFNVHLMYMVEMCHAEVRKLAGMLGLMVNEAYQLMHMCDLHIRFYSNVQVYVGCTVIYTGNYLTVHSNWS